MDPPPPITTTANHHSYPDSFDSSPRSRTTDSWDDTLPPPPPPTAAKLRLMCSYNGHIVPRPHDRSLCYLGGDTRIVVVDRHSSLADLTNRLSKTLLNGNSFTLKYQLPSEDLDSLITVTTDEDLENMIEEYDRTVASPYPTTGSKSKPSRLRLFLFPAKVESASSIGSLIDDSKSESWFVEALNGNGVGVLSRGFSDGSNTINSLLGLDGDDRNETSLGNYVKQIKSSSQDVHSIPDSTIVDTNSSFGSSSSMPSMSSLPPIRVHVEEKKVGLEEQFAQMSVSAATGTAGAGIVGAGTAVVGQKQDEGFVLASRPPIPTTFSVVTGVPASVISSGGFTDNQNRVFSDDERSEQSERSEQGVVNAFRKPTQLQQRTNGGIEPASPDGSSRDKSFPEAMSRQNLNPMYYQDSVVQVASRDNMIPDLKREVPNLNYQIQMQQMHDPGYVLTSQLDQLQQHQYQQQQQQQQFIPTGMRYVQQQATGQMPMPAYYQVLPQQRHQHQQQLDQQYPVYYVAVPQNQAYSYKVQPNISETTNVPLSRPPVPPNSNMLPTPTVYKEQVASGFPSRAAPPTKPEMAANVYRTAIPATPRLVQIPGEAQYVGYPLHQIHHDSQVIPATSATATTNYGYEYSDPSKSQIYHTQPHGTALPPQFQTTNPADTMTASEALTQLPSDSTNQQMRTPQPL